MVLSVSSMQSKKECRYVYDCSRRVVKSCLQDCFPKRNIPYQRVSRVCVDNSAGKVNAAGFKGSLTLWRQSATTGGVSVPRKETNIEMTSLSAARKYLVLCSCTSSWNASLNF